MATPLAHPTNPTLPRDAAASVAALPCACPLRMQGPEFVNFTRPSLFLSLPRQQRLSYASVYWDHTAKALHETSEVTVGQLHQPMYTFVMAGLFHLLIAVNLQVWLFKQFRMAQMNVAQMNFVPPFLWWRSALGALLNLVALYSAFQFVHSRLNSKPSGDSSGGIEVQ